MTSNLTAPGPAPWVAHRWSLWARLDGGGAAAFDAEGRLLTAQHHGFFRRGLDNTVLRLRRHGSGVDAWRSERVDDPAALLARVRAALPAPAAATGRTRLLAERARVALDGGYRADVAAFHRALGAVPVLPPNHSRSLVVRLTEGCAWNACAFCTLYAATPFRVKGTEELREHLRAVLAYFGEGAGIRPSIFLGDASALDGGVEPLRAALAVIGDEVELVGTGDDGGAAPDLKADGPRRFDGVYAFADVARTAALSTAEARSLARAGLRRLYLGVESGSDRLLRRLGKPHRRADVTRAVAVLQAAGIGAGVIVLAGAGGREHLAEHHAATAELVGGLGLGRRDFAFVSPLDPGACRRDSTGAEPLTAGEIAAETDRLGATLRRRSGGRLRVAAYHLESFVY